MMTLLQVSVKKLAIPQLLPEFTLSDTTYFYHILPANVKKIPSVTIKLKHQSIALVLTGL